MTTLYKKTATGSTQTWAMELKGSRYRTITGKLGGAMTTSEWTQATPKNVGRSNAMSPEAQAKAEVAAEYELKRKKGYRDSPEDAHESPRFQCMLAKGWKDRRGKLVKADGTFNGSLFVQPKLDGIRCIATPDGMLSRENHPITTMSHIWNELGGFKHVTLDGELYNHELHDDFPHLSSLVKREQEGSKALLYYVYDCIVPNEPQMTTRERQGVLDTLFMGYRGKYLIRVDTFEIVNEAELEEAYDGFLVEGYEGAMIRLDAPYEYKRSSTLLKKKDMQDAEFLLLEIHPGVGNASTLAKIGVVRLPNGTTGKVDIVGKREYLQELLQNKARYLNKPATIQFFGFTPAGKLRFPKLKIAHDTERM